MEQADLPLTHAGAENLGRNAEVNGHVLPGGGAQARETFAPGLWDFKGVPVRKGVYGMHAYVEAMLPGLAWQLTEQFIPHGGEVLDPFCGAGAVLAESVRSGCIIGRSENHESV